MGSLFGQAPNSSDEEIEQRLDPTNPDNYRPPPPRREEEVSEAPYGLARFSADFGAVVSNSAAFGLGPLINSGVLGTMDTIGNLPLYLAGVKPPSGRGPLENYTFRYDEAQEAFGQSRDRLARLGGEDQTFLGNLAVGTADVGGTMPGMTINLGGKAVSAGVNAATRFVNREQSTAANMIRSLSGDAGEMVSRYAPAEMLDNFLLASHSYDPTLGGLTRRLVNSAVAGGGVGVVQDIVAGNVENNSDLLTSLAVNAGFGAGGQFVLGEVADPVLRYFSDDRYVNRFVQKTLAEIPSDTGITPDVLRAAAADLNPGESFLHIRTPGVDLVRGTEALNRAFADLALPGVAPNQVRELDRMLYYGRFNNIQRDALNAVSDSMARVDERMLAVTEGASSPRTVMEKFRGDAAAITPLYDEMLSTRPREDGTMPIGARPVDRQEFIDAVRTDFLERAGISNIDLGGDSNRKVYDMFVDSLSLPPSATRDLAEQFPEYMRPPIVEGGPAPMIPVAQLLLGARTTIANRLKPQITDGFRPEDRAAARNLLKAIDDTIYTTQAGNLPQTARDEWSRLMRARDAHDLGVSYFQSRYQGGAYDLAASTGDNLNDPLYLANFDEFEQILGQMEGGEEARQAFNDGFRYALGGFIDRHNTGAALNVLLGEVDLDNQGRVFFNERPGERDLLKRIIGPEHTNTLLEAADERRILEARQAAVDWFEKAGLEGNDPAINALTVSGMNGNAGRVNVVMNGVSAATRKLFNDEFAQSRDVLEFLSSGQAAMQHRLNTSLEQIEEPPIRIGAGPALAQGGSEEREEVVEETRERETSRARQLTSPSLFQGEGTFVDMLGREP